MQGQESWRQDHRPSGSQGEASGKGSPLQGEYRMSINIGPPQVDELKPRIAVIGVGGAGGNAIANMIAARVEGVDFIVANTDAQALNAPPAERRTKLGTQITQDLGARSQNTAKRRLGKEGGR